MSVPRAVATGSRKELEDKGAAVKFWTDTNVGATAIHAAGREIEFAYGHFDKGCHVKASSRLQTACPKGS